MIPFTQYMLPNGEKREVGVPRPPDIEKLAKELIDAGYRFESEILTTGEVSLTCVGEESDDEGIIGDVDLYIEISLNGPMIRDAIDKLVKDAHEGLL